MDEIRACLEDMQQELYLVSNDVSQHHVNSIFAFVIATVK